MTRGRFAPSPTGALHLGNLRTALLALCFARHDGGSLLIRVEDLTTPPSSGHDAGGTERAQLDDLAGLGITADEPVVRQSGRLDLYRGVLEGLTRRGLTYPCFCTRREIEQASAAPHGPSPEGAYPGTCAHLSTAEVRRLEASGRVPALRLAAARTRVVVADRLAGSVDAEVDDFVVWRRDGFPAYNLSVVVDDIDQSVDQVVRGADLLDTTPRQALLYDLLGHDRPEYVHVPLVVGADGQRLAKRHGATNLPELVALGWSSGTVLSLLAGSIGVLDSGTPMGAEDVARLFDPEHLSREAWVFEAPAR
ncbi:MAG: tRNA glutamyl-Q(34) synthetase GluQRS [Microthrixaceae bacterium]